MTKKKIKNAKVYIKDVKGKIMDSTLTDQNGNYVLHDLEPDKEYNTKYK